MKVRVINRHEERRKKNIQEVRTRSKVVVPYVLDLYVQRMVGVSFPHIPVHCGVAVCSSATGYYLLPLQSQRIHTATSKKPVSTVLASFLCFHVGTVYSIPVRAVVCPFYLSAFRTDVLGATHIQFVHNLSNRMRAEFGSVNSTR